MIGRHGDNASLLRPCCIPRLFPRTSRQQRLIVIPASLSSPRVQSHRHNCGLSPSTLHPPPNTPCILAPPPSRPRFQPSRVPFHPSPSSLEPGGVTNFAHCQREGEDGCLLMGRLVALRVSRCCSIVISHWARD